MDNDSKVSFVDNEKLEEMIQVVIRQTDYTKEIARDKLAACNYDTMKCIREYMGITKQKQQKNISVNQQIYRELRTKMGVITLPDPTQTHNFNNV